MNFRRGNPFDIPKNPNDIELMLGWFFDQIRVIVSHENHHHKFDGVQQILDILAECSKLEQINVFFIESNGQWYLLDSELTTKEDILNLPKLAYRFSKVYRHRAKEFSNGDNEPLEVLPNGTHL